MAHISTWEKIRKSVFGSYSEGLTLQIAQEEAASRALARASRERIAAQQAAAKEAEAKFKAEAEKKAAAKIAEVKAAAKPQPKPKAEAKPVTPKKKSGGKGTSAAQ